MLSLILFMNRVQDLESPSLLILGRAVIQRRQIFHFLKKMAAILARNARCRFKPFFEKKINFIKHSTITQNTANSIENVYSNLYDVVISGGGIIGACLAVVLGQ